MKEGYTNGYPIGEIDADKTFTYRGKGEKRRNKMKKMKKAFKRAMEVKAIG